MLLRGQMFENAEVFGAFNCAPVFWSRFTSIGLDNVRFVFVRRICVVWGYNVEATNYEENFLKIRMLVCLNLPV